MLHTRNASLVSSLRSLALSNTVCSLAHAKLIQNPTLQLWERGQLSFSYFVGCHKAESYILRYVLPSSIKIRMSKRGMLMVAIDETGIGPQATGPQLSRTDHPEDA